jgi:hypothetical protein
MVPFRLRSSASYCIWFVCVHKELYGIAIFLFFHQELRAGKKTPKKITEGKKT